MRFRRGTTQPTSDGRDASLSSLDAVLGIQRVETTVMPNKAGLVKNMDLLHYEARVTSVTIPRALTRLKNTSHWGLKQWRLAHQVIFDPVYDWAGKLRTVNIRKSDEFVDKDKIEYAVDLTFRNFYARHAVDGDLAAGLEKLPPEQFSAVFADLYNDLNLAHPFREGNGRSLKTVLTAMARQAGRDFKWGKIAARKWDFDNACREAARGNVSPLAGLFSEVLEDFKPNEVLTSRSVRRQLSHVFGELAQPLGKSKHPVKKPRVDAVFHADNI